MSISPKRLLIATVSLILVPCAAFAAAQLFSAKAPTINWKDDHVQSLTLKGNVTLNFKNGKAGEEYTLVVRQDGTGGRTITWPSNVYWPGGVAPTLTTTPDAIDMAKFLYDGDRYLGTYWTNFLHTPPSAPTLTFTASPSTIQAGATSTISWSTTNVTSCTASNGWSGSKSTSGSQGVAPSATTTYALDCTGTGGSIHKEVTVNVTPVPVVPTLLNGLIHYWKLDESSGNAADVVGGMTLTNNNSTPFESGKIGNGPHFNGTTQNLTTTNDLVSNTPRAYTFCSWLNVDNSDPGNGYNFFISYDTNLSLRFTYLNDLGVNEIRFVHIGSNGESPVLKYNVTLVPGFWHHVCGTWNNPNLTLYFDGSVVSTSTASGTYSADTNITSLGSSVANGVDYLHGKIDEVGFWTRALSAAEVNSLYNGSLGMQYPF